MNEMESLAYYSKRLQDKSVLLQSDLFDPNKDGGYVYIIQLWNTDIYKIGITCDLDRRLRQLQSKSPIPLKIIFNWWGHDYRYFEKVLHKQFAKSRIKGEWFRLSAQDLFFIVDTYPIVYYQAMQYQKN